MALVRVTVCLAATQHGHHDGISILLFRRKDGADCLKKRKMEISIGVLKESSSFSDEVA
eukprot:CAMPEP_0194200224 /NCGR_PEP_ID=MMETSP0156-20130528/923_1 /TAXON_ID=33649 /ORGANISM="Thalassionema nitzschioides, Strain L26-B" /LENGTH=58 /DNA_ID=CAMNT_0038925197 /DNA_START=847 /DNA_END=1023 /DNA_ORIENTATION=-